MENDLRNISQNSLEELFMETSETKWRSQCYFASVPCGKILDQFISAFADAVYPICVWFHLCLVAAYVNHWLKIGMASDHVAKVRSGLGNEL